MLGAVAGLATRDGRRGRRHGGRRGLLPGLRRRSRRAHRLASTPAMVIAIDGPAGAGKSTVARAVAERARLHLPRHRGDVPRASRCSSARARPSRGGRPRRGDRARRPRAARRPRRHRTRSARPRCRRPRRRSPPTPRVRDALVAKQRELLATAATGSPRAATSAPSSRPTPRSRSSSPRRPRSAPAGAPTSSARRLAAVLADQRERDARDRDARALAARRRRADAVARRHHRDRTSTSVVGQIVTLVRRAARQIAAHEGRGRRLPERRQVLAGQPAHAVARGRRARAPGHHARPQGARRPSGTGARSR